MNTWPRHSLQFDEAIQTHSYRRSMSAKTGTQEQHAAGFEPGRVVEQERVSSSPIRMINPDSHIATGAAPESAPTDSVQRVVRRARIGKWNISIRPLSRWRIIKWRRDAWDAGSISVGKWIVTYMRSHG